jgi:hypothetical protein
MHGYRGRRYFVTRADAGCTGSRAATKIDLTSRGRAYSRERGGGGEELVGARERERERALTKQGELGSAVPEAAASRACTGAGETKRRPAETCMQELSSQSTGID